VGQLELVAELRLGFVGSCASRLRRRCESDPVTPGNEYYFCLNHHRVEGVDGCSAPERLGPYPDEATAARALEIVQERNEAADEYDES
jgi:hypothetical protein